MPILEKTSWLRIQTGNLSRASLSQLPVLAGSEGTAMIRPRGEGKRGGARGGREGGSHDVELLTQTPAQCRDAVLGAVRSKGRTPQSLS